jgi:hypothetical protein
VELISKFSGVDLIFFDFAFWHPESRRRMHQRERCIYGTGISSLVFLDFDKTTYHLAEKKKALPSRSFFPPSE